MDDTDKIVAAILAAAYAAKNIGAVNAVQFVRVYEEVSEEMKKREKQKPTGLADAVEPTAPTSRQKSL
jgi:hypothetical protein